MPVSGYEIWAAVRTHADFGRATAAWMRGELAWSPTHGAPTDPETAPLLERLIQINEAGFVTDDSQPGIEWDGTGSAQRAYVQGYCDADTAALICAGLATTPIICLAFPPGTRGTGQIVVTYDEWQEHTWCGRYSADDYSYIYSEISPGLDELVRSSWHLQLIDPVWGRPDLLVDALLSVVSESTRSA